MSRRGPQRAFARVLPPDDAEIRAVMEDARRQAEAAGANGFAAAAAAGEAREALLHHRARAGGEGPVAISDDGGVPDCWEDLAEALATEASRASALSFGFYSKAELTFLVSTSLNPVYSTQRIQ